MLFESLLQDFQDLANFQGSANEAGVGVVFDQRLLKVEGQSKGVVDGQMRRIDVFLDSVQVVKEGAHGVGAGFSFFEIDSILNGKPLQMFDPAGMLKLVCGQLPPEVGMQGKALCQAGIDRGEEELLVEAELDNSTFIGFYRGSPANVDCSILPLTSSSRSDCSE